MYDYIKGELVSINSERAVVDVGGVGYRLLVPLNLFGNLQVGALVHLYTSWVVRELSQTLFGFSSEQERDLFEVLITISGIGPKTGLNLIGRLSPEKLNAAIIAHDVSAFSSVPGIGKKTAERLLIDLKGKHFSSMPVSTTAVAEALQALLNLGFSQAKAERALKKAQEQVDPNDLSALISLALRS